MNKSMKSLIAIYGIIFVIITVIGVAIPFEKTQSVIIAYGFSVISLIAGPIIFHYAFKGTETLTSKVYGFPIFRIGYIYTAIQMIFTILITIVSAFVNVPAWVSVVVSVLFMGGAAIGVIASDNARDIIENQEATDQIKTKTMTYFRLDISSVADMCSNADVKKKVMALSEKLKYSDPVSNEQLVEIESKILKEIGELKNIVNDDVDKAIVKVDAINLLVDDRNRRCKALK